MPDPTSARSDAESRRPAPQRDRDSAFFWAGLRAEQLLLQRCSSCEHHRFPPLPACPRCGETQSRIDSSPGAGHLYSWIVVHRGFSDAFADDVPYTIGVVELDEGCRMLARLELDSLAPCIGMRLGIAYRVHCSGETPWTEAFFRPAPTEGLDEHA